MSAKRWRRWIHGLVAAALGGASHAVGAVVVMPDEFNFGQHFTSLLKFAAFSAFLSVLLFFRQAPPPIDDSQDDLGAVSPNWKDKQ